MKYVFTLALTLISLSAWGQDFVGTSGNDVLVGSSGNDTFQGGDGSDEIYGQGGDDTITVSGNDLPAFFGPLASRVWSVVMPFSAKC
jgi:hypothetical protein